MEPNDRTEKLMALLLLQQLKSSSMKDKAVQLSIAGFSNIEIADLLQTTTGAVAVRLHEARHSAKKKKKPKTLGGVEE
jgi:DNA-directed RNA polymerase specialized sigma24 family protein